MRQVVASVTTTVYLGDLARVGALEAVPTHPYPPPFWGLDEFSSKCQPCSLLGLPVPLDQLCLQTLLCKAPGVPLWSFVDPGPAH